MNSTLRPTTRLAVAVAAGAALVFGTTACSLNTIERDDLSREIATKLAEKNVPVDGKAVSCAEDLPAEVGATRTCEFHAAGQPVGAVVRVTSVEDGSARFDITTEARPVPRALLQDLVSAQVAQQTGAAIDRTDCTGDLPARSGDRVGCKVTSGGESIDLAVRVDSLDHGMVNFTIVDA
jgi:hypothetical protein